MHSKQLAAALMAVFGQKSAPPMCVLGNPRTGGVRSCSWYCRKELVLKVEGSMYLVIFMAQDWAMRLVAKKSFEFLVFAGWFRVKPLATVRVEILSLPLSVAPRRL